jgi:PAS domain S-box-containing protein
MFTSDLIQYFEELGSTIGIAFKRMQIEKHIKESEEQFRRLTENAQDIIYRYELLPESRFSYISPVATKITGYTPEEYYADADLLLKLVHQEDLHFIKNISEVFDHPRVLRCFRKDGEMIWIDQRILPIVDEQGNLIAIEGIIRDITKQKMADDKLARERILLRTLIDNLPDNIYIKDTKLRKVLVNKADLALIGKHEEEVIGKDDSELYPEKVAEQFMTDDRAVIEKGQPVLNREELLINNQGQKTWLLTSKLPLYDHEGQISGLIGIGHDITKRKKYVELLKEREQKLKKKKEEYLRLNQEYLALNEELSESIERIQKMNEDLRVAKEKAEESDKLKTAFLHNISHEIRTPLNGIIGFSDLLTKQNLSLEKREKFAHIIRINSEQLISIINDIITIATIEAGHEKPHEKEADINMLLKIIESQNSLNIKAKNLSFSVSSELNDDEAIVLVDETKLLQILTNLVNNAVKFTSEGYIKVSCNLNGDFMQFTVEDTGIGIPSEMHERIFDRFFQIDHSDTRLYGGTGLGLSIVKSYVHFLNGKILVDSEPGKGSVFTVLIPYKPVKYVRPENIPAYGELKKIGPATILVAEDEIENFELLNVYLSDFDLTIIHADNGLQAVEACKRNPSISLVLMDVKMPNMDGYEAAKKIKEIKPHLPIIIQTAFVFQNEREKSMSAYIDGFIEKPINQNILLEYLYKYLQE